MKKSRWIHKVGATMLLCCFMLGTLSLTGCSLLESLFHSHTYVEHAKVDATCVKDGNIHYYSCSGCDKLFDKNGVEIGKDKITIPALGHDRKDGGLCSRCEKAPYSKEEFLQLYNFPVLPPDQRLFCPTHRQV